jgi:F0F1-type ATP synthase assembly protein I
LVDYQQSALLISLNYPVFQPFFSKRARTCLEMDNLPDDRSSYANAMVWVSRITSISIEMVLPGVIGYYLIDRWLGTKVVFLILGLILGFVGGIWQLIKLTKQNGSH